MTVASRAEAVEVVEVAGEMPGRERAEAERAVAQMAMVVAVMEEGEMGMVVVVGAAAAKVVAMKEAMVMVEAVRAEA